MNDFFLLFVSYEQLARLKSKHRKQLAKLGFLPHEYFNPVFFSNYKYWNNLSYYTYENCSKIINYKYADVKLCNKQKDLLKELLFNMYKKGICPVNLLPQHIFLTEENKILLFITRGLISSNLKNKKLYNEDFIDKKINNFINKL